MIDIARLGIEVDSSQAARGSDNLRRLTGSARDAERSVRQVGTASASMSRGLSLVSTQIVGLVSGLVGVTAAVTAIRRSVSAGLGFDIALAEASTLIEGTEEELDALSSAARNLAVQFGTSATEQVNGFYQAISAGAGSVEEATRLLDQANRFATGGVTDLVTGVDLLTTAVNSYGSDVLSASDASDALFIGIKAGKTNADELGASLGRVTSIAASVGLSFDQLVASVAALTAGGIETAEAVTSVRSILAGLLAPTTEATKLAEKLGIEFNVAALEAKGLGAFLKEVAEKTGGSDEAIATLFGNVRALAGVMAFTGAAGDKFNETMAQMEDRAGATETAFDKVAESLSKRLEAQLSIIADRLLGVGLAILERLVPALEAMTTNARLAGDVLTVLAATQVPRLIGVVATMTAGLTAATFATGGLSGALTALGARLSVMLGPWGLLAGAVAAVILNFDKLRDALPRALNAPIRGMRELTMATDNAVAAAGDEITQIQLLSGVLGPSVKVSEAAARQKLAEAQARYRNVAAILEERRVSIARSEQFKELTDRIGQAQKGVETLQALQAQGSAASAPTGGGVAFGMKLVDDLKAQRDALFADIDAEVERAAAAVKVLADAVNNAAGGMVELGDATIKPIETGARLAGISTDIAGSAKSVADNLRLEIELLQLTADEQEKFNALQEAGVLATSAQGAEIISLVDRLQELRDEQARTEGADRVLDDLRSEIELVRATAEERERLILLRRAGVEAGSPEGAEIINLSDRLKEIRDEQDKVAEVTRTAEGAFSRLFDTVVSGSGNAGKAVRDLGIELAKLAASRLLQQLLTRAIGAFAGGASGGGGTAPPIAVGVPSAQGNVFTGGRLVPFARGGVIRAAETVVDAQVGRSASVIPFARGGVLARSPRLPDVVPFARGAAFSGGNVIPFAAGTIVSTPTTFPMADGRTGLMGEAGHEAIMPLTRTSSGELGVIARREASAASPEAPTVIVQIVNNANGTTIREERAQGPDGRELRRFIVEEVGRAMAQGEFDKQQRSRFGHAPQRVVR